MRMLWVALSVLARDAAACSAWERIRSVALEKFDKALLIRYAILTTGRRNKGSFARLVPYSR